MAQSIIRREFLCRASVRKDGTDVATIAVNDDVGDGHPIDLQRLDLEPYKRNPVVFFGHDRWTEPGVIGRSPSVTRNAAGHLEAPIEWLPGDRRAGVIRNAWRRGFLRAASIGVREKANGAGHELIEWSIVPIPADPDALKESQRSFVNSLLTVEKEAKVDPEEVKRLIREALAEGNGKDDKVDLDALTARLSDQVKGQVEAALKARDDAQAEAEKERAAKEKAEKEKEEQAKAGRANAQARAELLVDVRDLLPEGTETKDLSDKEIIVKALGDTVKDADKQTEDYLRGVLDQVVARRKAAGESQPQPTGGSPAPVPAGTFGGRALNAFDIRSKLGKAPALKTVQSA